MTSAKRSPRISHDGPDREYKHGRFYPIRSSQEVTPANGSLTLLPFNSSCHFSPVPTGNAPSLHFLARNYGVGTLRHHDARWRPHGVRAGEWRSSG